MPAHGFGVLANVSNWRLSFFDSHPDYLALLNEEGAVGVAENGSETFIPVDFGSGQSGALRVAGGTAGNIGYRFCVRLPISGEGEDRNSILPCARAS